VKASKKKLSLYSIFDKPFIPPFLATKDSSMVKKYCMFHTYIIVNFVYILFYSATTAAADDTTPSILPSYTQFNIPPYHLTNI